MTLGKFGGIMNRFVAIVLSVLLFGAVDAYPKVNYSFRIHENKSRFSKCFEIQSDEVNPGTVWKRPLTLRTCYDLFDGEGEFEAEGICRFFCMGLLYEWGTEIDVYDQEERRLGYIEGKAATTAAARFDIWNGKNRKVGIAYLNNSCTGITVYHPDRAAQVICSMERVVIPDAPDYWEVTVHDNRHIDRQVLEILAAWAVDRQSAFREDT
jgi:hypothetical protein